MATHEFSADESGMTETHVFDTAEFTERVANLPGSQITPDMIERGFRRLWLKEFRRAEPVAPRWREDRTAPGQPGPGSSN